MQSDIAVMLVTTYSPWFMACHICSAIRANTHKLATFLVCNVSRLFDSIQITLLSLSNTQHHESQQSSKASNYSFHMWKPRQQLPFQIFNGIVRYPGSSWRRQACNVPTTAAQRIFGHISLSRCVTRGFESPQCDLHRLHPYIVSDADYAFLLRAWRLLKSLTLVALLLPRSFQMSPLQTCRSSVNGAQHRLAKLCQQYFNNTLLFVVCCS